MEKQGSENGRSILVQAKRIIDEEKGAMGELSDYLMENNRHIRKLYLQNGIKGDLFVNLNGTKSNT
ncbi:MAG: hypothetical protein GC180_10255 [Bacteroidetes bacterium]|nr:hypothetical protein [Bacteroidota bacterium]